MFVSGHPLERAAAKPNQVFGAQCGCSVGAAAFVAKLYLERIRGECLDHCPNLPANEAAVGQVPQQGYFGEQIKAGHLTLIKAQST